MAQTPAVNPSVSALSAALSTAGSSPAPHFNTESVEHNAKVDLADICALAASKYAHKDYEEAAELYARGAELNAELNGELSADNAEVLFLYGRSLFKLGQVKSDVLGGQGGEKKRPKKEAKAEKEAKVAEEGVAIIAEGVDEAEKEMKKEGDAPKSSGLFQFVGDDLLEESGSDDDDEDEEEEEEDDELATAFEVLDLARVLFERKRESVLNETSDGNGTAEEASKDNGKGKAEEPAGDAEPAECAKDTSETRHLKERLADTHDLLAEISLENERFPQAVADFQASLGYKQKLYPFFSEIIAEAHYKLSLALEFTSITTTHEADEKREAGEEASVAQIDEKMREEAAEQLKKAIKSTEGKLQQKEVELEESKDSDDNELIKKQIIDCKEVVVDMKQRVSSLFSQFAIRTLC